MLLAYTKTKGVLLDMIDHVPLCSLDDLDRFKIMCQAAIDAGELEKMKKFNQIKERELKKKRAALDKERGIAEKVTISAKKKNRKNNQNEEASFDEMKQLMLKGQQVSHIVR